MLCMKSYITLRGTKFGHWLRSPSRATTSLVPKWVFCNKQDEDGQVVRNKGRLVAQGYTQVKGMDYGETYAPVARIESIRILLAYANHHDITLYQMDIKSAFLNGEIEEEVYVKQPPRFVNPKKPDHV